VVGNCTVGKINFSSALGSGETKIKWLKGKQPGKQKRLKRLPKNQGNPGEGDNFLGT